ncbi:MAG TPA: lytic transglycosylase domain-containing protein [Solirubrobacteraceae bacterium]|jgi:soluble lytic murein transglycosylase|nr:lytic transglycosylase domain-containing protein [Solirubrobacteraceae bacterium]
MSSPVVARVDTRMHRPRGGRGRALRTLVGLAVAVGLIALIAPRLEHAVHELALPLRDASVIRQQAAEKHLDPALIAGVIYAETKFDPRPSAAGAQGLMQILPSTAEYLAHLSGGVSFQTGDLATPAINIAYGSYYLRYLIDHYEGNETLAVAAYNAGMGNVDEWVASARAQGKQLTVAAIPFPETREYVRRVLGAEGDYRATYARQLGLD